MYSYLERKEQQHAAAKFWKTFAKNAKEYPDRKVSWPQERRGGGSRGGRGSVFWHKQAHVWGFRYETPETTNRFLFFFGLLAPEMSGTLSNCLEINPPTGLGYQRSGGIFLKDTTGAIFVAHSGLIGGGKKGVGQTAFLEWSKQNGKNRPLTLLINGKPRHLFLLGALDEINLPYYIGDYARQVQEFKKWTQQPANNKSLQHFARQKKADYSPEYVGSYQYKLKRILTAHRTHGLVVDALRDEVERLYPGKAANDRRDLYIIGAPSPTHVFEVKTGLSSGELQQAIGQVMVYTALEKKAPARVVVFPMGLSKKDKESLAKLKINLVEYTRESEQIEFKYLKDIL